MTTTFTHNYTHFLSGLKCLRMHKHIIWDTNQESGSVVAKRQAGESLQGVLCPRRPSNPEVSNPGWRAHYWRTVYCWMTSLSSYPLWSSSACCRPCSAMFITHWSAIFSDSTTFYEHLQPLLFQVFVQQQTMYIFNQTANGRQLLNPFFAPWMVYTACSILYICPCDFPW